MLCIVTDIGHLNREIHPFYMTLAAIRLIDFTISLLILMLLYMQFVERGIKLADREFRLLSPLWEHGHEDIVVLITTVLLSF